jgi:hypothetical protein
MHSAFESLINFSLIFEAGEDGQIKIWSKTGMLRSVLVQGGMSQSTGPLDAII